MRYRAAAAIGLLMMTAPPLLAHDGPPFPIVSDARFGPYVISVWTDPDTTDDGSAGGQFWVMMGAAGRGVPPATQVRVSASPLDRTGPEVSAPADPESSDPSTRFAALTLDHEGRFRVRVDIEGPLGPAAAHAEVMATYDLRPPPYMLALYLLPFLLVGGLWARLLLLRRTFRKGEAGSARRARLQADTTGAQRE